MKILGVDTTGESMSVAITDEDVLGYEVFTNIGKKHSQTLMLAIDQMLGITGISLEQLDAFAVSTGPGSFTGIRIGTAAVSALAYAQQKPVYAVNALDALLENVTGSATVCAVMDARRGEVYTKAEHNGELIIHESALPLEELLQELMPYERVVFVGDAAAKYEDVILRKKPDSTILHQQFLLQRASSVCMCAWKGKAQKTTHDALKPHYLRMSQAERLKRNEGK
ncbi:tRNA (adenosine(37)-N6)-threonylcarbamoyltransferase complex dimerization subunit type 1 TsaB [Christensenellaceae bacterium OttesenSCG-928-K19]|nr:tRNA (adenosine(37)-N6)-threonylcarbamoyltransferase complex dimerization subunit type 1 TsaB [Christensenellaceae bacterium OttesenSCG-928-K19]